MLRYLCAAFLLIFGATEFATADVASVDYVKSATRDKVSATDPQPQTLSGTYVITGSLEVPDAPLPSALYE